MPSRDDLGTLALSAKVPPVGRISEEAKEHARCIVVERVYGLGGLPGMGQDDPAEATRDILGALGILPNQPPPKTTIKHDQWMKILADREVSDSTT